MNLPQQLLLLVWTKLMEKLSLFTILEVVLTIFQFLKSAVEFSKLRQQMVTLHLEVKTLISKSKNFL